MALPSSYGLKELRGRAYEALQPIEETEGSGYVGSISSSSSAAAAVATSVELQSSGEWSREWNADFQALMDSAEEESEEKFAALYRLAHDFVFAALHYGKIVISELCVPAESKTVRQVAVGGIAGGSKFVAQNILFKQMRDTQVNASTWLYGGAVRNDFLAMKAALHELKGAMSWFSAHVPQLHLPLMAAIDFLGHRLLAISVLPIDRTTLVSGSSDGGVTMHAAPSDFAAQIERAAASLNLQPHVAGCGDARVLTSAPGDLEGHVGHDKRHYLLDFSRTMPPEFPFRKDEPRSVYSRLLRPEFVRRWRNRLCCDSFTNWQANDPDAAANDEEILAASRSLMDEAVPQFARVLDEMATGRGADGEAKDSFLRHRAKFALKFARILGQNLPQREIEGIGLRERQSKELAEISPKTLITELHRAGINVRFLGLLRHHSSVPSVKRLVLLEMAARVVKNLIRERLRDKMLRVHALCEEPFKQVVLEILSQCVGARRSHAFWQNVVAKNITDYFRAPVQDIDVLDNVDQREFIRRIQELADVRLSAAAENAFIDNPSEFEFVDSDIAELLPRVRHLYVIDFAEGMALALSAQRKTGRERIRLLKLSEERLERAIASYPDNFMALYNLGKTLALEADDVDTSASVELLKAAIKRLDLALALNESFDQPHFLMAKLLARIACIENASSKTRAQFNASLGHFKRAIALNAGFSKCASHNTHPLHTQILPSRDLEPFCSKLHSAHSRHANQFVLEGIFALFRNLAELMKSSESLDSQRGTLLFLAGEVTLRLLRTSKNAAKEHELFLRAWRQFSDALAMNPSLAEGVEARADDFLSPKYTLKLNSPLLGASILYSAALGKSLERDSAIHVKSARALLLHAASKAEDGKPYIAEAAALLENLASIDPEAASAMITKALSETSTDLASMLAVAAESPAMHALLKKVLETSGLSSVSMAASKDFGLDELCALCKFIPTLAKLDLSFCSCIGDGALAVICSELPSLRELLLDNCRKISFKELEEASVSSQSLRSLSVSESLMSDAAVSNLSRCFPNLDTLDLSKCIKISSASLQGGGLTQLSSLTSLSLSACLKVESVGFLSLANRCTGLRRLDVSGNSKLDDTVVSLVGLRLRNLEDLNLDSCTKITDDGLATMLSAISSRGDPKLTCLNVRGCRLLTDRVVDALIALPSLRKLNIGRLQMLSRGVRGLAALTGLQALRMPGSASNLPPADLHALLSRMELSKLDLSQSSGVTEELLESLLTRLRGVRTLYIRHCSSIESFERLSLEKHSGTLQSLDLSATKTTDKAVQHIASALPLLEKLRLNGCTKLSSSITDVATRLTRLRLLDLGNCSLVPDASARKIAEHLVFLEHLTLDGCHLVSPRTFSLLALRLTRLTHLSLKDCTNVDDRTVRMMASSLWRLRSVNLVGCGSISEKPMAMLRRNTCLEKAALSLASTGIVHEIEHVGFSSKLREIPAEQLKWLRRSREMREQSSHRPTLPRSPNAPSPSATPLVQQRPAYLPFSTKIPYSVLCKHPDECDPTALERYLTVEESSSILGPDFSALPKWRQDQVKRAKYLF